MTMPVANPPKILAFDTSSRRGSVALLEGQELKAELKLHHLKNHSANLIRSIDFLLDGLDWKLEELNLAAVGIGPGSFTGIRIGIATCLGIAQSLSIPYVGISGLESLAYQNAFLDGTIGVVLNAHREQAYYTEYVCLGGKIRLAKKPCLVYVSELKHSIKGRRMYIVGDTELVGISSGKGWPRAVETEKYLACGIGRRAASVKRRWRRGDYAQCDPLYIRPPDAMKKRGGV